MDNLDFDQINRQLRQQNQVRKAIRYIQPTEKVSHVTETFQDGMRPTMLTVLLVCIAFIGLMAYLAGWWSFGLCIPVGNGLQFCI